MQPSEWATWREKAADVLPLLVRFGYTFDWHEPTGYVVMTAPGGIGDVTFKTRPELTAFQLGWMAARLCAGEARPAVKP